MFSDDTIMPGERVGEYNNSEKRGEYADRWENAMTGDDVPEFAGEWGYGENDAVSPEVPTVDVSKNIQGNTINGDSKLSGASQLTSYGFDTASRMYGINTVLEAIVETDETGLDADNPIDAIYARLTPNPDERKYLYQEIQKENVDSNPYDTIGQESLLGMTADGQFYDKTAAIPQAEQTSVDAIRSMRRVLEMLETSERFADVRTRAAEQGKTVVEYLVSDETNPTLSHLLNRIGDAMSEDDVEELVEELETEANGGEVINNNAVEGTDVDSVTAETHNDDPWSIVSEMAIDDQETTVY